MTEKTKSAIEQKRLEELVYTDELTGIYNRRFFNQRFAQEAAAAKDTKASLSFFIIDVDHFKKINDTYGHLQGDRVLTDVAALMRSSVGGEGISIRYAGDEFVVLLPGISKQHAMEIAQRMADQTSSYHFIRLDSSETITITLSIGVSNFPEDTDTPDALFDGADRALYVSKKSGRNQVCPAGAQVGEVTDPTDLRRLFPCPALVGRERLTDIVERLPVFQNTLHKNLLALEGPSGTGKSRMLAHIRQMANPDTTVQFTAKGNSYLVKQPYRMLADSFTKLCVRNKTMGAMLAATLSPLQVHELSKLIPDIGASQIPGGGLPVFTEEERQRALLDGFSTLLKGLAGNHPMLVTLDEFHWADPGTLQVMERILEDPDCTRILFAVAIETGQLTPERNQDLVTFLERVNDAGRLHYETLNPLTYDQVKIMVATIFPRVQFPESVLAAIHAKSMGLPMMVEELLKFMIQKEILAVERDEWVLGPVEDQDLPASLAEIMVMRMEGLDEETRTVLSEASVVGRDFNVDVLKTVAGKNEGHVQDILDKAIKANLIREDQVFGAEGTFDFISPETQHALYQSLDEKDKEGLHQLVAQAQEALAGGNVQQAMSELAYHYKHAGNLDKAIQYSTLLTKIYEETFSPKTIEVYVGEGRRAKSWGKETKLSRDDQLEALKLAQILKVSISNIRLFPAGSEMIRETQDTIMASVESLLARTETLTFSEADGALLLNGQEVTTRSTERNPGMELMKTLAQSGLKGISFKRGLERREVDEFLNLLCMRPSDIKAEGGWDHLVVERDISHIVVNEKVYVAVGERELFEDALKKGSKISVADHAPAGAGPDGQWAPSGKAVEDLLKLLQEEREVLRGELLSSPDFKEKLEGVISSLSTLTSPEFQNVAKGLAAAAQASQMLSAAGTLQQSGGTPPALPSPAQESAETPGQETQVAPRPGEVAAPPAPAGPSEAGISFLNSIDQDVRVLISDLESADHDLASRAYASLLQRGSEVKEPLIRFVMRSEELRHRKVAAELLKRIDGNIGARLLEDALGARPEEIARIVSVLDEFDIGSLMNQLEFFVTFSDAWVRQETAGLLERSLNQRTVPMLLDLLGMADSRDEAVVKDIIACLGRIQSREAIPALREFMKPRSLFEREYDVSLQCEACQALGRIGGADAAAALLETLRDRGALQRSREPQVRAAAAWALGHTGDPAVKDDLVKASQDRDPTIRSAAKMALEKLMGGHQANTGSPRPARGGTEPG